MSDAVLCLLVLAVVIALFVWNRLPVELVALGSALLLPAVGLLPADRVFAGFGDPVVALIAALFVVSTALQATGVTTWAGRALAGGGGGARAPPPGGAPPRGAARPRPARRGPRPGAGARG
ncbi:SLC13 family permease, partial [Kitasatospora sp. NPDC059800]|uniref:SLC13 family permease n=1 Tax=Kitasatospora sp. NPDC059800 TaxID=3346951 RepID=UPI00364813DE